LNARIAQQDKAGPRGPGHAPFRPAPRRDARLPAAAAAGAPFVSVVIPVRNERDFLAACLDSVLANDYPAGRVEILAIDGASNDGSRAILDAYAARFPRLRILDNPQATTPAALNLGIAASRGEIFLRLDAHARLAQDYISQCVDWLAISGADNVGGAMRTLPRGTGLVAEAVALALSHPFGVGGSAFRTRPKKPCWTDTVFGGCYRREVFERVGGFNERLPRGQDMEFNLRLKRAGGRTLLVPSIRCDYFARSGLGSFLRHNWTNGVWAIRPFFESAIVPVRPRHLAPLGFVLALATAAAPAASSAYAGTAGLARLSSSGAGPWPLLILLALYGTAAAGAAIDIARREHDARLVAVLPGIFCGLHLAYGLGSLWGLLSAVPILAARCAGFSSRFFQRAQPTMKRCLDLMVSAVALVALSPLLVAIAYLIRRGSPGPAFYRGRRVGLNGGIFRIYKFRTMVVDAETLGGPTTADDDPRLTPIGRFLRRYKLDELPQLLNVVKAEMSFVGPRPEVVEKVARYSRAERRILELRPGITDWASIWNADEGAAVSGHGDADQAYERLIRPTKIHLQLLYRDERSVWVDAKILLYTLIKLCNRGWLPAELADYPKPGQTRCADARNAVGPQGAARQQDAQTGQGPDAVSDAQRAQGVRTTRGAQGAGAR
jgi:lipopolysaccharide/colanic/teichoic acid biosynthesis glycosyltransferase